VSAKAKPTADFSFGFGRAEVLGALLSVVSLWVLSAMLIIEAYSRCVDWWLGKMGDIDGRLMFAVACLGVVVNIALGYLFHSHPSTKTNSGGACEGGLFHSHEHSHSETPAHDHQPHDEVRRPLLMDHDHSSDSSSGYGAVDVEKHGDEHGHDHAHTLDDHSHDDHKHSGACEGHTQSDHSHGGHEELGHSSGSDVNIDAAYLHVLTDLAQSVLVALCGLAIWVWPAAKICDPVCTLVFAVVVVLSTVAIFRRVVTILLEGTPAAVDPVKVKARLLLIRGVLDVHDLHVWNLSSSSTSLTCHIIVT
jgi:zinc transporter 2